MRLNGQHCAVSGVKRVRRLSTKFSASVIVGGTPHATTLPEATSGFMLLGKPDATFEPRSIGTALTRVDGQPYVTAAARFTAEHRLGAHGVGEMGTNVVPPAISNAIFTATGVRLRSLHPTSCTCRPSRL